MSFCVQKMPAFKFITPCNFSPSLAQLSYKEDNTIPMIIPIRDLRNTTVILNFVTEFEEVVEQLRNIPEMFESSRAPEPKAKGYHNFSISNYVAPYLIDKKPVPYTLPASSTALIITKGVYNLSYFPVPVILTR